MCSKALYAVQNPEKRPETLRRHKYLCAVRLRSLPWDVLLFRLLFKLRSQAAPLRPGINSLKRLFCFNPHGKC